MSFDVVNLIRTTGQALAGSENFGSVYNILNNNEVDIPLSFGGPNDSNPDAVTGAPGTPSGAEIIGGMETLGTTFLTNDNATYIGASDRSVNSNQITHSAFLESDIGGTIAEVETKLEEMYDIDVSTEIATGVALFALSGANEFINGEDIYTPSSAQINEPHMITLEKEDIAAFESLSEPQKTELLTTLLEGVTAETITSEQNDGDVGQTTVH